MPVRSIQPLTPPTLTRHQSPVQERIRRSPPARAWPPPRPILPASYAAGRLGGDNEGALAGQQALMDPATCPLPIAYFPPILVLGHDLDGHGFALKTQSIWVARAGPGADIDLIGPERGKTRQRQARALPLLAAADLSPACGAAVAGSPAATKATKLAQSQTDDRIPIGAYNTLKLHVDRQPLERMGFSATEHEAALGWTRRALYC